jgi:hypothetical protein
VGCQSLIVFVGIFADFTDFWKISIFVGQMFRLRPDGTPLNMTIRGSRIQYQASSIEWLVMDIFPEKACFWLLKRDFWIQ